MQWILRFFAILDIVCLFLMGEQAYQQFLSFLSDDPLTSLEFFSRTLFLLAWLSLVFSAIFLAIPRKAGIIIYYCQIMFRMMFFIFSFGFISLITYLTETQLVLQFLMPLIIFGELLRLFFTYRIHKKYF
jgi:hypothetical protein